MELFRQIKRQTPESVELEFLLAGIGSRAYALLVDYTILALLLTLVALVASLLAAYIVALIAQLTGADALWQWLVAIAALVGFAIYVGYFVLFEAAQNGQTPGKKLAKIQVVCDDGRPLSVFQAVLRALVRPLDDFLWIGFFMIVLGKHEKRLGDLLAGTLVVQTQAKPKTKDLWFSDTAKAWAPRFRQSLDLDLLIADDVVVLQDYLQRRPTMRSQAEHQLAIKLASEIRSILQLAEIPTGLGPQAFLEAVYLAYQSPEEESGSQL